MLYAVIVAGGSGTRMQREVPKQFLEINNKPILYYTIRKFIEVYAKIKIILVLPQSQLEKGEQLRTYLPSQTNLQIISGGVTRYHSVQNGLQAITEEGIVFIHDGVRPLVSKDVIVRCYETTLAKGNSIPCITIKDSLRIMEDGGNKIVNRNLLRAIQTPQTFRISEIKHSFKKEYDEAFTDEASVFERDGHKINLVEGNEENIKITTPFDLVLAEHIISTGY